MASKTKTKYWGFKGGLDIVTPALELDPGRVLGCRNYEIGIYGGYRRIEGYERYDGQPRPSDASYWILDFDTSDTEVVAGQIVTGVTSGATGTTVIDGVLESGSYAGGDAAGYFVLYGVSTAFQSAENLQVSAATVAVSTSISLIGAADNDTLDTTYFRAATEAVRDNISAVPGDGIIRGVWTYNDVRYAFRNNAGGTAVDMYKSTAAGWVKCDLGHVLFFTAGTAAFTVGSLLTGGSSSANGIVGVVGVQEGTWGTNDAVGYVVLYSETGTPFTNPETITDAAGGSATTSSVGADNAFPAGGSYEFKNYNFTGHSGTTKMYGVNGVGEAFVYDGSYFSFIPSGMDIDTPNHIEAKDSQLILSFPGGNLQASAITDPHNWTLLLGGDQIGVGDEITGLLTTAGNVMTVFARNSTYILTGAGSANWVMKPHSVTSGAIEGSIQQLQGTMYLDDRGLTLLQQTQAFGDFQDNTVSELIQPRIDAQKSKVVTSTLIRSKNQYIIYFSDNTAIAATFDNRTIVGFMDLDYEKVVRCIVSGEDGNGDEEVYFGSDDGYIYQLNKGTSFDGSAIGAFLRTPYNHMGSPQYWKRFRRVTLEMSAGVDPNINLEFAPEFSYSDPDIPTPTIEDYELKGGGGFWNSAIWNQFYWSGQAIGTLTGYIDGIGYNMSLLINSNEIHEKPHAIHGAVIHYSQRGMVR